MSLNSETRTLQQHVTEDKYGRHNIRSVVLKDIMKLGRPMLLAVIDEVTHYMNKWHGHNDKQDRVEHILRGPLSDEDIAIEIMILVLQAPTHSMQGIVGRLASMLHYDDEFDGVQTAAELIGAVCHVDLYDIKITPSGAMVVVANYALPKSTAEFVSKTKCLPPMVCTPRKVTNNYTTHNLTTHQCVILGSRKNHHGNTLALDALNIANSTSLSLDLNMLGFSEEPTFDKPTFRKTAQFNTMARESTEVYEYLLNDADNKFHVGHRYCKRGRMYAEGYHVNTQGTEYKKAIINFTKKVVITGV